jgi:hypothetical protein
LTDIVVKDSKPKKAEKKVEKNLGGRPRRDPETLRTDRLVIRIHPDLMSHLSELAKKNGLTRSMLVERALVSFVNLSTGQAILDSMGRELKGPPAAGDPLGTPASFDQVWRRAVGGRQPSGFEKARRAAAAHNRADEEDYED